MSVRAPRGPMAVIAVLSVVSLATASTVSTVSGASAASGTSAFTAGTAAAAVGGGFGPPVTGGDDFGAPVARGGDSKPSIVPSAPSAGKPLPPGAKTFGQSVKAGAVRRHLEKFQEIADANGGNRAAGTPGHEASVDYVADRLRTAGYRVTLQKFVFSFFRELKPPVLERVSSAPKAYVPGVDFATMTYSGSGEITARVRGVDLTLPPGPSSTSGCEVSDFKGFVRGDIALLQRGTCTFQAKVETAQAAGAAGVILFNEGQAGEGSSDRRTLLKGSVNASGIHIPVVSTTFAAGRELSAGETTVKLVTDTRSELNRETRNVIADSPRGDPDKVVMVGAHLDSVTAGPGINDNGSGSAGILETALAAKDLPTTNRLRFAFWGAEELGLLGSKHYVDALTSTERSKIKLYLNFDMIASPNYVIGVYDGDGSAAQGGATPPPGSAQIEKVFEAYFKAVGSPYQDADFSGRSDYGPFIAVGIPSGGLFTGAEGIKTAEEAAKFGGEAGVSYDRCYHQACDGIANVDDEALRANSGAIGAATFVYAYARDLPGGPSDSSSSGGPGGP